MISREAAVLCGCDWFAEVFRQLDPQIRIRWSAHDGEFVKPDQTLCHLEGPARPLLTGERTALNFLQTLSAAATAANAYAEAVKGTGATILDTRKTLPGLRLAEPGEFTRRAFMEGKLDLAQAEAVADLIDAASRESARSALRSLTGEFSAAIHVLVEQLTELRALTEAVLDFPQEEVDGLHLEDARARLGRVRAALDEVLAKSKQGSLLRSGIHVVFAGRPNVGKSSLLNRLAGEDRAIVTSIAGTTRDALREPIQIDGVPITVVDTAGLRESSDEVERLGVERTWREVTRADVVLVVLEAPAGVDTEEREMLTRLPGQVSRVLAFNKVDLVPGAAAGRRPQAPNEVWVSAKTGAGLEELRQMLLEAAGWSAGDEPVFLARERHLRALGFARRHLDEASRQLDQCEFFAEELRLAQAALAAITGEFTADDLLGEIFARFCIGK